MSLSNMNLFSEPMFSANALVKPRIKRWSNGEFLFTVGCDTGKTIAKRYIDYVLFLEATEGRLILS